MNHPYDEAFRDRVACRCAAFTHLGADGAGNGLKPAAVAILLLETEDGSGEAAFLLTRRLYDQRTALWSLLLLLASYPLLHIAHTAWSEAVGILLWLRTRKPVVGSP